MQDRSCILFYFLLFLLGSPAHSRKSILDKLDVLDLLDHLDRMYRRAQCAHSIGVAFCLGKITAYLGQGFSDLLAWFGVFIGIAQAQDHIDLSGSG